MAAGAGLSTFVSPERGAGREAAAGGRQASAGEEYVWVSANAHLPLFVAHDHPALFQIGEELGVRVTIAGPDTVDIPGLVATVEQTAARRPTGMMVVGWDPSALIPAINRAVDSGVPVVCVDADVPASRRLAFIGTDWYDLGVRQGEAMLRALAGRRGKVAMLGLIEQAIDQQAFAGFRSVAERAGLTVLEPQQDKGNQAEAARVAGALLQAHADLVGMAGFDSESGPGMGQAIREAGKAGKLVATCVDAEEQHLRLLEEGILTACVGQKRELFTYYGVRALYDFVHSTLRLSADDRQAGIRPIPVNYNTGTFTVTRDNVDIFLAGKG
jgi:ABC-type sugar transport system substrate-binding protein